MGGRVARREGIVDIYNKQHLNCIYTRFLPVTLIQEQQKYILLLASTHGFRSQRYVHARVHVCKIERESLDR